MDFKNLIKTLDRLSIILLVLVKGAILLAQGRLLEAQRKQLRVLQLDEKTTPTISTINSYFVFSNLSC